MMIRADKLKPYLLERQASDLDKKIVKLGERIEKWEKANIKLP